MLLPNRRRLNRGQTVVHVVQKMLIKAKLIAHRIEQLRGVKSRYFSVDQSCSSGQSPLVAGS
jgi:hypothetical protein